MSKKRFTAGVVAATAVFSIVAATFSPPSGAATRQETGRPTIAGIVASSGNGFDTKGTDYDVLLAAVQAAGLVETLNTPGLDVTVWAPNDRAFVKTARDLGFTGAISDEEGAWNFLVEALTGLGNGDPIPVLTTILQYHVTPGARGFISVLFTSRFPTLAGPEITKGRSPLTLVDQDPDLPNPRLTFPFGVRASNGVIHTITRVLIPINI